MEVRNAIRRSRVAGQAVELPQLMMPNFLEVLIIRSVGAPPDFDEYGISSRRVAGVNAGSAFTTIRLQQVGFDELVSVKEAVCC